MKNFYIFSIKTNCMWNWQKIGNPMKYNTKIKMFLILLKEKIHMQIL